jgi:beta-galactosidase
MPQRIVWLYRGNSQGTRKVKRNSHVEWNVRYVPGVLEAYGRKNGGVVLTTKRETTSAPRKLVAEPDRTTIAADGRDLSVITIKITDAQGRVVPTAANEVRFKITGPGRLIGVGNGDPSCHEPDKPESFSEGVRSTFNGLCMAFVQSLPERGQIRVSASAAGLQSAVALIQAE